MHSDRYSFSRHSINTERMEGRKSGGREEGREEKSKGGREERKMKIWWPKEELEVKEHDTQGE